MTNREILKAVLEKGINQGYTINQVSFDYLMNLVRNKDKYCQTAVDYYIDEKKYYDTIFSHDFAKAFWGEELTIVDEHYKSEIVDKNIKEIGKAPYSLNDDYIQSWKLEFPKWKFHLREMILEENPLKYLEKFL